MTALWCLLAYSLVQHQSIGAPLRRYAAPIAAFALVGIGILVMYQTGSFGIFLH
jgi:cadmium resistance protein CadD (predicted permease)